MGLGLELCSDDEQRQEAELVLTLDLALTPTLALTLTRQEAELILTPDLALTLTTGKKLSFAEASLSIVKNWQGTPLPCAVGTVLATRKPIFIKDAKSSSVLSPQRVLAAREYGIDR